MPVNTRRQPSEKKTSRAWRWQKKRIAKKLCYKCSEPTDGYLLCPRHRAIDREYRLKRYYAKKAKAANGKA